jgi:hypothetical protein
METFRYSLALAAGLLVGALQMLTLKRWRRPLAFALICLSVAAVAWGAWGLLSVPKVVVALTGRHSGELGSPYPYRRPCYEWSYQGLSENGFVIWTDCRFFELGLDHQYWHSFADPFPTNDLQWFTRATLRARFPECGDRLPCCGLAKAMIEGPEKQFYSWLGCLQAENASSFAAGVLLQRFQNGYVIEGVLDPPQSRYRRRFVLLNDAGWESESVDDHGQYFPPVLH